MQTNFDTHLSPTRLRKVVSRCLSITCVLLRPALMNHYKLTVLGKRCAQRIPAAAEAAERSSLPICTARHGTSCTESPCTPCRPAPLQPEPGSRRLQPETRRRAADSMAPRCSVLSGPRQDPVPGTVTRTLIQGQGRRRMAPKKRPGTVKPNTQWPTLTM